MTSKILRLLVFSGILVSFLTSCTTRRYVPQGKYLVQRNNIVIEGDAKVNFSKSDLAVFNAQRANKSFLGTRFQLWMYYVTEKRVDKRIFKWLNETVGVAPVYADQILTNNAATQMKGYLNNIGYFNSEVTGQVKKKKFTAEVFYNVQPSRPYVISKIGSKIPDTLLASYVDKIKSASKIKTGMIYNVYQLDEERDRITDFLKNHGYYYFSRDYIFFEVDSNQRNRSMHLNMRIDNVRVADSGKWQPHKRYFINKVKVFPDFKPMFALDQYNDSSMIDVLIGKNKIKHQLNFYSVGDPRIRPQTFGQVVQMHNGEAFNARRVRQTYRSLANFSIYSTTNIEFVEAGTEVLPSGEKQNLLDVNIELQRNKVHGYAIELEGTNSGGDLGLRGSLVYNNKNIFRGAEVLRVSLKGGIEAQRITNSASDGTGAATSIFNTNEFGLDASILFPRFLSPIPFRSFIREYQPKTNISVGISFQNRPDYSRYISQASFGYDWMATNTTQHIFSPINLNSVKVNPTAEFQAILDQEINQRVKDQYSNHLIFGIKYSFIFNNQNIKKLNDFFYFRANMESSGNLLSLLKNTPLISQTSDYSELFGIRYAQFMRFDFDFRYYRLITASNQLVVRTIIGFGIPYGNSQDMPFERSFYGGGANGMRGWQFRELGPGNYNGDLNVERIGDIQLETSLEYRFPISGLFKGALFTDVGNIWTINENSFLPGGQFNINNFYEDLAVDAGFGFRFDFSFFIFRIDAAVPLRDPSRLQNQQWVVNRMQLKNIVWNFGIGYPF